MKWADGKELSLRIEKEGPVIDPDEDTHHLARIDVERAVFDTRTPDADNHNMTATMGFVAFTETPIWNLEVVTTLATLP